MPVRSSTDRAALERKVRSSTVAITNAIRIETPALIQVPTSMPLSAANMRAILLDAMGTLIGFAPPAPHLQAELRLRGHEIDLPTARAAIRAEITYYRAHLDE